MGAKSIPAAQSDSALVWAVLVLSQLLMSGFHVTGKFALAHIPSVLFTSFRSFIAVPLCVALAVRNAESSREFYSARSEGAARAY